MRFKYLEEYLEWKAGLANPSGAEDELLHAFKAIKILSQVKFVIATIENPGDKLAAIEEEVSHWIG